jgi:hypothetical protein
MEATLETHRFVYTPDRLPLIESSSSLVFGVGDAPDFMARVMRPAAL